MFDFSKHVTHLLNDVYRAHRVELERQGFDQGHLELYVPSNLPWPPEDNLAERAAKSLQGAPRTQSASRVRDVLRDRPDDDLTHFVVLVSASQSLRDLYDAAWGKQWPRRRKTVELPAMFGDADSMCADVDGENPVTEPHSPNKLNYDCLDLTTFRKALGPRSLVVLKEYDAAISTMYACRLSDTTCGYVVTGHPGIEL